MARKRIFNPSSAASLLLLGGVGLGVYLWAKNAKPKRKKVGAGGGSQGGGSQGGGSQGGGSQGGGSQGGGSQGGGSQGGGSQGGGSQGGGSQGAQPSSTPVVTFLVQDGHIVATTPNGTVQSNDVVLEVSSFPAEVTMKISDFGAKMNNLHFKNYGMMISYTEPVSIPQGSPVQVFRFTDPTSAEQHTFNVELEVGATINSQEVTRKFFIRSKKA